ncbi:MAG: biopolymer transporter ExbD [Deltaproteobacteria bacterium]|nr:biopolymer transporter ExbD [Deltaproteobacteria bacterium]
MATQHQIQKMRKHARHPKKRAKGLVKADINVTPLVDVVLVLLIIFMVVTPMIVSGVAVDLPKTSHHKKKADDGKDIIVSIAASKDIYVMGKKVRDLDELVSVISEEKRKSPEKNIFMKADNRITYGLAREVMEKVNKAGVEDVLLGTEEFRPDEAAPAGG